MPTHEKAPWERDARSREEEVIEQITRYPKRQPQRSRRRGTSVLWVVLVVAALVVTGPRVLDSLSSSPSESPYVKSEDSRAGAEPVVEDLRSRWVSPTTLEIRGRSNVDGFRIRLRGSVSGRRYVLGDLAPRVGRFRTTMPAPAALHGRKVRVSARLILE